MVLLTSCNWSKDRRVISKIERTYEKHKGYKCEANIRMFSGEKESIYLMEETYDKPNKYKLEILSPKESKGIIILNTDDKVFVEHPSINQSISLVTIKTINSQLLIGEFFEELSKVKLIDTQEIGKVDYLVFDFKLKDKNKYRDSARIWLKKKGYIPYKLNIYDEKGSVQVEITYEAFKFTK
jgi:outer membrane lipoprotein-sorting protein